MSVDQVRLKMKALVALYILVMLCSSAKAYHGGAPEEACGSMEPSHHGVVGQTTPIPYRLSFSEISVEGGAKVKITLSTSAGAESLKGFLVKAVDSATETQTLGAFDVSDSGADVQTISCSLGTNNAVTHTNNTEKTEVVFDWIAPSDFNGNAHFLFTVVQDKETFWVKGKSDVIAISTPTALPCASDTSEQPIITTTGGSCVLQVSIVCVLINLAFAIADA